jgi:hypothetical protein
MASEEAVEFTDVVVIWRVLELEREMVIEENHGVEEMRKLGVEVTG